MECNEEGERNTMKKLDWKGVGQFFAVLINLITIITTTLKKAAVSIEILDWLTGAGKSEFVAALEKLGESYKKSVPEPLPVKAKTGESYVIHSARVNLSAQPKLPFSGATVESNTGGGMDVLIEMKSDGHLYVDGKKIVLHLEQGHRTGSMHGHKLREALRGKSVMNAALLDFLKENPQFIPNYWKVDEKGNTRYIYFWRTVFRSSDGSLYVRCLYWNDGKWIADYRWLGDDWSFFDPAAVSAS